MRSFFFKLRYVYRNVTRNFFRTFSLLLTIAMLSFILLTAFTVKDAISTAYMLYETSLKKNIDIEITFDAKSESHIIDSSKVKTLNNYIDYYCSFFEISTLVKDDDKQFITTLYAGEASGLSNFIEQDLNYYLQYNEVIITRTLANKLDVEINDEINIFVANTPYLYIVKEIVDDFGFFRDDRVLVSKDYFVKEYMFRVMSLNINDFSSIELATTIYLNVKDNVNIQDMLNVLSGEAYYPNSVVKVPTNYNDVKANVDLVAGILYAVLAIFITALSFVMVSIVNLRIKTFKNEAGIIEILGEKKSYVFKVLAIEILILAIIGFFLAYLLDDYIYYKEFSLLSGGTILFHYHYKASQIILTISSILLICLFTLINSLKRFERLEVIELAKNKQFDKGFNLKKLIIYNIIFGTLTLITWLVLYKYLPIKYISVLGIIVTAVFGVFLVSLMVKLICKIFKFDQVFNLSFIKNLKDNKIKHNSLKILLISLFGIVICFACIETINKVLNDVENSINIDDLFVNPSGVDDEMEAEFLTYDAVVAASKGWFERKISTTDGKTAFLVAFSCDIKQTKDFMNFVVDEKYHEEFANPNKHYIIVANDFVFTTDYQIGDIIKFRLSDGIHEYQILGCVEMAGSEFAYTNDYYHQDNSLNTILIKYDNHNQAGINEFRLKVTEKYSNELCYIYNGSGFLINFLQKAHVALQLIYVVIAIILGCFIVSIINNTILNFGEVKGELAMLEILGISLNKLKFMIFKEIIISYLSIFLPLVLMVYLVLMYLPGLTLLLGYYVKIRASFSTILLGFLAGMICFVISYIYYFIGVSKIKVAQEVKRQ